MTKLSRREREKEKMKEIILSATIGIIKEDGIDNLSIRKIAKKIEYSPSIIYHYFKDKDEILINVMQSGYRKIIDAVSISHIEGKTPKEKLLIMTKKYIDAALKMPDEFIAAQLNQSEIALNHTASLHQGASKEKPALAALYQCLKEIHANKDFDEEYLEMSAQMIAVSTLGFILKLIIEKDVGDDQKARLKEFFINEIIGNLAAVNN